LRKLPKREGISIQDLSSFGTRKIHEKILKRTRKTLCYITRKNGLDITTYSISYNLGSKNAETI